jgi:hypothetical protein
LAPSSEFQEYVKQDPSKKQAASADARHFRPPFSFGEKIKKKETYQMWIPKIKSILNMALQI